MPAPKNEPHLDLTEDAPISTEHLESQVQKAQEQLLQLRHQQEQIEKQKRELEELSRRQEQFEKGKAEVQENLVRALPLLEREHHEIEHRLDQLQKIHEIFSQHLSTVESIDPRSWNSADLSRELNKAFTLVEEARIEYQRYRMKINADSESDLIPSEDIAYATETAPHDFFYWLKAGAAFTLVPTVVAIVIIIVLSLNHA